MKTCSKCGAEKQKSEFFMRDKNTDKLHAQCKACYKIHRQTFYANHYAKYKDLYLARAKERRDKLRKEFRTNMLLYLSNKSCTYCNESDIRTLEFDHIDPKTKLFNISQAVKLGHSWDRVMAEIKKCRVVCANCHKKHTAQQFGWYKSV